MSASPDQVPEPIASPAEADEHADPAPGDRRRIAWAVTALVLGLSAFHMLAVRPTMAWVGTLPGCEQAAWLSGMLVAAMALMPLMGLALFLPIGLKVWRHGCWPYPGMWLWRRTRVHRGWRARLTAVGMIGWTLIALPLPLFAWHVVSPLMDRTCQVSPTTSGSTP